MTSIRSQVTRSTVVVAGIAVLVLGVAAAAASRFVFEADEAGIIGRSALALRDAIRREMAETRLGAQAVAQDSIDESALADYVVEIWSGGKRIATNRPAETIGPGSDGVVTASPSWIATTVEIVPGTSLVVAASRDRGARATRILAWSLLLAAPFALGAAVLVGRGSARRVTEPLLAFRDRFLRGGPLAPVAAAQGDDPLEVAEMDAAFRAQWRRVKESFDREREFAANAAHELRTPLTRLRLSAERLHEQPAEAVSLAAGQVEELSRLARVVDALLVLSRSPESGLPATETVNLADVTRAAIGEIFGGRQTVRLDGPDEAMVRGDEDLLRVAVSNLLDNARKFGPREESPTLTLCTERRRVRLRVTTPGARIDGPERDLLFERFYRSPEARADTAGHGLGLSLARHVALIHGGDVTVASPIGADATFLLDLPVWEPRG